MNEINITKEKVWESIPSAIGLRRHIATGIIYFNKRVGNQKLQRTSGTDNLKIAKAQLAAIIAEFDKIPNAGKALKSGKSTFGDLLAVFKASVDASTRELATKKKIAAHITTLLRTWKEVPGFEARGLADFAALNPAKIGQADFEAWRFYFAGQFSADLTNATLGIFRNLYKIARQHNPLISDPTTDVPWTKAQKKPLVLPDIATVNKFLEAVKNRPQGGICHRISDLVEGLIYSGLRIGEARQLLASHVELANGQLNLPAIICKGRGGERHGRVVPILPGTEAFWARLVANAQPDGHVFWAKSAEQTLVRACKEVGIQKFTHHKLRHLWATLCVEKKITFKQVASWLGHQDGGILAASLYSHVRIEHAKEVIPTLTFGIGQCVAPALPTVAVAPVPPGAQNTSGQPEQSSSRSVAQAQNLGL